MISCYLLLTDVVIDPDVGSEDTELLGEGRASATENKNTMSYHVKSTEEIRVCNCVSSRV